MIPAQAIRLNDQDNLVVALADLAAGSILAEIGAPVRQAIPRGHKVASRPIAAGERVIRYGQIIGVATAAIAPGDHIHSHNLGMGAHDADYAFSSNIVTLPRPAMPRTFNGFHRADGQVGTRNYLGVLTSVNCSGSVARFIAEACEKSDWLADFPNVDGVVPIVHGTGCGMSGKDEGYETLFRTLQGYSKNPNFGGILLVGLGCEVMQIPDLVGRGRMRGDGNFRYMTIQQTGGTRRTIDAGVAILKEMAAIANAQSRAPAILASPRTRRWGRRPTCWWPMAAPRSCRKPRKSTGPSIC
jgi:altronate dehydratase